MQRTATARRLPEANIFEQGAGLMDLEGVWAPPWLLSASLSLFQRAVIVFWRCILVEVEVVSAFVFL